MGRGLHRRRARIQGFSTYHRPYAENQSEFLARSAHGDAVKVKFDREAHLVERAARREDVPTRLAVTIPTLDKSGAPASNPDLPLYVAYAHQELLTLRQLAVYGAGVARAHDIPSGPKKVRAILETIDRRLLLAATGDPSTGRLGELREVDIKDALRAVGAKVTLTNGEHRNPVDAQ